MWPTRGTIRSVLRHHNLPQEGRLQVDREQLEALRRQVEEDYKLDIAAIERLQRRFMGAANSIPGGAAGNGTSPNNPPLASYASSNEWRTESANPVPPPPAPPERRTDELEGSLRTMFSSGRK